SSSAVHYCIPQSLLRIGELESEDSRMGSRRIGLIVGVGLVTWLGSVWGCGSTVETQIKSNTTGSGGSPSTSVSTSNSSDVATSASSTTGPTSTVASTSSTVGSGGNFPGSVISMNNVTAMEAETHVAAASNGVVAVAWIGIEAGNGFSTNGYIF